METLLHQNEKALHGIADNFPIPGIGGIMSTVCFPTGKSVYQGPTDPMVQKVSQLISKPSGIRDLLSEGIFISKDPSDRIRQLNDCLPLSVEVRPCYASLLAKEGVAYSSIPHTNPPQHTHAHTLSRPLTG